MATPNNRLTILIDGDDNLTPKLKSTQSAAIRWVGSITAAFAAVSSLAFPVKQSAEFESGMADVAKTTNFTERQIDRLADRITELSRRTNVATKDLTAVAAAAGQQGLGKEGVKGVADFTEAVSRMASVLNVEADEAGASIGKILNIFKEPIEEVERTISSLNETSNKTTATGEELLDVVKRLGNAGGALKIQQAIGLAASALDFGVSPEVAGTSLNSIFIKLRQNAKDFGRLMDMSATDWIAKLDKDGVEAFKDLLARLRQLDAESQTTTIVKLIGGGRIGALLNKYIQDTTDSVLNGAVNSAVSGYEKGTSAIQEQQRVLATLNAQYTAFLNSAGAASRVVGDETLAPLTRVFSKLNAFLASEDAAQFLNTVGESLASLISDAESGVEIIGSLGINFENLLVPLKAFIALKVGQGVLTLLSNFKLLGPVIRMATTDTRLLADMNRRLTTEEMIQRESSAQAFGARILGLTTLLARTRELTAAQAELTAATAANNAAQARLTTARSSESSTRTAAQAAQAAAAAATAAKQAEVTKLAQLQQSWATKEADIVSRKGAKVASIEAANNAKVAAIQSNYQAQAAAIRATGSQAGLAALRRTRDQELANQDASYQRQLRSTNAYWDRRLLVVQTSAAREVGIQQAALATSEANLAAATAQSTALAGALRSAERETTQATRAASVTSRAYEALSIRVLRLREALTGLSVALRIVGAALKTVATAALNLFFLGTLVYMLLDMLGVTGKLGKAFQSLTDWMGLTSEASRKQQVEQERHRKRIQETTDALIELNESYEKYLDNLSKTVPDSFFKSVQDKLEGDAFTLQDRITALRDLIQVGGGAAAEQSDLLAQRNALTDTALFDMRKAAVLADDALAELLDKRKALQEYIQKNPGRGNTGLAVELRSLDTQIEAAKKKVDELNQAFETSKESLTTLPVELSDKAKDIAKAGQIVATLFTDQSAGIFQDGIVRLAEIRQELDKLKQEANEARQKGYENEGTKAGDQAKLVVESIVARQQALSVESTKIRQNVLDTIEALSKQEGITKNQADALDALRTIANLGSSDILNLSKALKAVQAQGIPLTGANAGSLAPGQGTGDDEFKARDKQKAIGKARLELLKAQLAAEFALVEAENKAVLASEEEAYSKGLISLKDYYDEKERVATEENAYQIKLAEKELAGIRLEISEAKDQADKTRFQADLVSAQSRVDVLKKEQDELVAQNERARQDAVDKFHARIIQEAQQLANSGVISQSFGEAFDLGLQQRLLEYKDFLHQLQTEAAQGNDEAAATLTRLMAGITAGAAVDAMAQSSQHIQLILDKLSTYQSRLSLATQEGMMTTAQAAASYDSAVEAQISSLTSLMGEQEDALEKIRQATGENSLAFQQQQSEIEKTRLSIEQLAASTHETARSINESMRDAFSDVLADQEIFDKSFKTNILNLANSILGSLQETFAKDITERLSGSLGMSGSGGIGGFFAGILEQGAAEPGADPGNPLYTKDADLASSLMDGQTTTANALTSKLGTLFSGLMGSFKGFFSSLLTTLMTVLTSSSATSGVTGFLGSLFGSAAGGSTAAASSSSSAATMMVAHTGAIVGRSATRSVPMPTALASRRSFGTMGTNPASETIAMLKKGEEVLSSDNPRHIDNQNTLGGGQTQGIRNILVTDPSTITGAMSTSSGEKVIMSTLQKANNLNTIRQLIRTT